MAEWKRLDANLWDTTEFVVTRCKTGAKRDKFPIGGSTRNPFAPIALTRYRRLIIQKIP